MNENGISFIKNRIKLVVMSKDAVAGRMLLMFMLIQVLPLFFV